MTPQMTQIAQMTEMSQKPQMTRMSQMLRMAPIVRRDHEQSSRNAEPDKRQERILEPRPIGIDDRGLGQ